MNRFSLAAAAATAVAVLGACWLNDDERQASPTEPVPVLTQSVVAPGAAESGSSVCQAFAKERDQHKVELGDRLNDRELKQKVEALDELIADACN